MIFMPLENAPPGIQAMRIRFLLAPPADAPFIAAFVDPYPRYAVAEKIPVSELPPPGAGEENALFALFLQGGIAVPVEWQRRATEWMSNPEGLGQESTIELLIRSDRILWRPGRAMIQGAVDRLNDNLAGLVDFTYHDGELRKLEREIMEDWEVAERDIKLTVQVGRVELAQQSRVNKLTCRNSVRRMRIARLTSRLEKASITLPPAAQRIVSELIIQTEVANRINTIDRQLEVITDIYERATNRIYEYSYFSKEARLECIIILILFIETVLIVFEIWQSFYLAK